MIRIQRSFLNSQLKNRCIVASLKGNGSRFYSTQYNYQGYQNSFQGPPPRRPSWPKRILLTLVGLSAITAYGYFMWWPKHTFPSSVAKILRKGLWAESDKGENDYQLALKYYIEALTHCDEIKMDSLSDEYTGIQLKIGEMFERLGMMEDAAFIYNEVATLYMKVLTAPPDSVDGKRVRSNEHRAHLIQKDLRLAIKLVDLNKTNAQLSKAILITHLLIAQDEVQKKLGGAGAMSKFVQQNQNQQLSGDQATVSGQVPGEYKASVDKDSIEIDNGGVITKINKNPMAWEPFTDEFFNAMDLLTAICISTGDLSMASKVKVSMTEWMLLADVEPHKVLLSQCNLASLLYLQAEEFEAKEIALKKMDPASLKVITDTKIDESSENGVVGGDADLDVEELKRATNDAILAATKAELSAAVASKEKCIQLSIKSYEAVLEFAKNLPQEVVSSSYVVNETVALATYGLGVVHLHLSDYTKAERLLREARVRSKSCGYQDLIVEIERELNKLFKEKKQLAKTGKPFQKKDLNDDIEIDIQLKK